jgi:propanol-preferring alcohol dehydrogenase
MVLSVAACAVCRTDLQLTTGDLAMRRSPVVPGHQIVGQVVEVGSGVRGWHEGDRAGVGWLAGACGTCTYCISGRENLCDKSTFTGWDCDGGFASHTTVQANFAFKIPEAFDDVHAAPLLCGGIIGYRALKVCGIAPGQRLGLYGFGASASLAMQVARFWDCRVFVASRSEADRVRARAMGAEWTGTYEEPPPEPLDAAVTFAPVGSVVVAALAATDRGGTVAVNAIHLDQIPAFSYDRLWWERSLRSVANYTRRDAREFLDLAAHIPIQTTPDLFDLGDANLALAKLEQGAVTGAAVLRAGH